MATELEIKKTELVIKSVSDNKSLTSSLKEHGIASADFFETIKQVPLLSVKYAHAQSARAELMVDEILDIADNETDSQKARNRIDVRKWAASKMKPEKFGDRIDVNINQTVDIRSALEEAKNRIRNVLEIPETQLIETTESNAQPASGLQPAESVGTANFDLEDLLK